ncbi:molybdate ABC transporter permease subunit [Oceanisphaera pacifica]|uniref:Molybdenum transport system permease n=1 Tax=Oceanisphaera pacifica TaxID=2818389 RepID=A0ABS3NEC8_9GAMM|nr:molybdate ABC transporter permease subunit [Oceanisphaera pacifica]MBO1518847.1 molybdate ABC transporter permease subunit [Oceanisphaera pacifica]
MSADDITALLVTLRLAGITVVVLLIIGMPLAWWLSQTQNRFKTVVEAMVALPLVLPPVVLGFYMLLALGPNGIFGKISHALGGGTLAFSFTGLVIGSAFYSLPFVVQPLQGAFANLGSRPLEVAATLRASPLDRFFTVVLPLARNGFLTAVVLGFAHTLGEFGVVLMIGGNIPGVTQVVSIAIYDHVETLQYGQAHLLSGILLVLSFSILLAVYALNRRFSVVRV